MSLESILSANSGRKFLKRVGRGAGSGLGKTCGRGHKGAGSRSGGKDQHPLYEGGQFPLWMRLPKRGFSNANFTRRYVAVQLAEALKRVDGDITVEALVAARLADDKALIKIVSGNDSAVENAGVSITVHRVTKSVRTAVEAAGGSITELDAKKAESAK